MYYDFHTHLHNDPKLASSLKDITEHDIVSVACSVDIPSFEKCRDIGQTSNLVIPTFGIHPMKAAEVQNLFELDTYLSLSSVIGEIGLDQRWFTDVPLSRQISVFEYILDHCSRNKKYCVIHTSGAEKTVYDILLNFPGIKPVIHWYDGDTKLLTKMIDRGFFFTYGLELHYSQHTRDLLETTPMELILSETDNPGSETWLGGTEEGPLLITRVLADIALLKKINIEEAQECINRNSMKILQEASVQLHR